MQAITDFANNINSLLSNMNASIDGIAGDVDGLKKKIEELLTSQDLTPEDKATLEGVLTATNGISSRLAALDEATAPLPVPQ